MSARIIVFLTKRVRRISKEKQLAKERKKL
jgi:hypothetical protein